MPKRYGYPLPYREVRVLDVPHLTRTLPTRITDLSTQQLEQLRDKIKNDGFTHVYRAGRANTLYLSNERGAPADEFFEHFILLSRYNTPLPLDIATKLDRT